MSALFYGEWWNEEYMFLSVPMSEDAARALYEARGELSVVRTENDLATYHPEVNPDFDAEDDGGDPVEWFLYFDLDRSARLPDQPDVALLYFYDFWGTLEAHYRFVLMPDDRLFLTEVAEYDYPDAARQHQSTDWSTFATHSFGPDGTSSVVVRQALPDGSTDVSRTDFQGGDFSTHWEPVPQWGDWASITRRDRSRPA